MVAAGSTVAGVCVYTWKDKQVTILLRRFLRRVVRALLHSVDTYIYVYIYIYEREKERERAGPTRVTKGPRALRVHGVIRPRFVFVACAAQKRAHAPWPASDGRRMRSLSRGTTTAAVESWEATNRGESAAKWLEGAKWRGALHGRWGESAARFLPL